MSEEQVLTITEVAAILKPAEKTVCSMAQGGELPAFKVRAKWRIRKVGFEKRRSGADPQDPHEYRAENIFWVPKVARWPHVQGKAKPPTALRMLALAIAQHEKLMEQAVDGFTGSLLMPHHDWFCGREEEPA